MNKLKNTSLHAIKSVKKEADKGILKTNDLNEFYRTLKWHLDGGFNLII